MSSFANKGDKRKECLVCGNCSPKHRVGWHYGGLTCDPCRRFFLKHCKSENDPARVCTGKSKCEKFTPPYCAACRLKWCYEIGMDLKLKQCKGKEIEEKKESRLLKKENKKEFEENEEPGLLKKKKRNELQEKEEPGLLKKEKQANELQEKEEPDLLKKEKKNELQQKEESGPSKQKADVSFQPVAKKKLIIPVKEKKIACSTARCLRFARRGSVKQRKQLEKKLEHLQRLREIKSESKKASGEKEETASNTSADKKLKTATESSCSKKIDSRESGDKKQQISSQFSRTANPNSSKESRKESRADDTAHEKKKRKLDPGKPGELKSVVSTKKEHVKSQLSLTVNPRSSKEIKGTTSKNTSDHEKKKQKTNSGKPAELKKSSATEKRVVDVPSKKSRETKHSDSGNIPNFTAAKKVSFDSDILDSLDYEFDEICGVDSSHVAPSLPPTIESRVIKILSCNTWCAKLTFDRIVLTKEETDLILGAERSELIPALTREDNIKKEICRKENSEKNNNEDFENSLIISDLDVDELNASCLSTHCENNLPKKSVKIDKKPDASATEKENKSKKAVRSVHFSEDVKNSAPGDEKLKKKPKAKDLGEPKRSEKPTCSVSTKPTDKNSLKNHEAKKIKVSHKSNNAQDKSKHSNTSIRTKSPFDSAMDDDVISIMAPDVASFFSYLNFPFASNNDFQAINPDLGGKKCVRNQQSRNQQKAQQSPYFEPPTTPQKLSEETTSIKENPENETLQQTRDNSAFCYTFWLNHGHCPQYNSCPKIHKHLKEISVADILDYFKYLYGMNNWKEVYYVYNTCKIKLDRSQKLEILLVMVEKFMKLELARSYRLVCELKMDVADWVDLNNEELIYDLLHNCSRLTTHNNHLRIQFIDYFCKGRIRPLEVPVNQCLLQLRAVKDCTSFWKLLSLCVKWRLPITAPAFSLAIKFVAEQGEHTQTVIDVFGTMSRSEIKKVQHYSVQSFLSSVDKFCGSYKKIEIEERLTEKSSHQRLYDDHLVETHRIWNVFINKDFMSKDDINVLVQDILTKIESAGDKFTDFVKYVKKKLNADLTTTKKRYMSRVGVAVLFQCHDAQVFYQAFKVLQALHLEKSNYFELRDICDSGMSEFVSASTIAQIAADTCLRVHMTESTLTILRESGWALPCSHEKRADRLRMFKLLFEQLLVEKKLSDMKLIFTKLLESYKDDRAILGQNYLSVVDLNAKFDDLIGELLNCSDGRSALTVFECGRAFSLSLSRACRRGLLILFYLEKYVDIVAREYRSCQDLGVYPLQKSSYCIVLRSYYTREEIQIIVEDYLHNFLARSEISSLQSFCVQVEELPIDSDECYLPVLRVPLDLMSFVGRFTAVADSFLPPLIISSVEARTIYIDTASVIQYVTQNLQTIKSQRR